MSQAEKFVVGYRVCDEVHDYLVPSDCSLGFAWVLNRPRNKKPPPISRKRAVALLSRMRHRARELEANWTYRLLRVTRRRK